MPLVNMKDMLTHAYRNGYAVGGFDIVSLDFLEAVVAAAENTRSPVILSLAECHFGSYDFELLTAAVERAANRAGVPIAIHFDHGTSVAAAERAIRFGCNGVMVDASHEDFPENVAHTRSVVEMAHACGITVEGELGYIAGVEGEDADKHSGENIYTSVKEAVAYVERTGVDCLAVSIGTVHGRLRGKPKLDFDRLKKINDALHIPLVIHGGSGLSDDQFRRLISFGVAKINYFTGLSDTAAKRIRANVRADTAASYAAVTRDIRDAVRTDAERCMILFGSAGRAAEVAARCAPWQPVHHVIVYNTSGLDDAEVAHLMARGREVLSGITGVRKVVSGWVAREPARYRFCWLIEFAHPNVIESYRDHPAHVEFADRHFRAAAGDRISLDFVAVTDASVGHHATAEVRNSATRRIA